MVTNINDTVEVFMKDMYEVSLKESLQKVYGYDKSNIRLNNKSKIITNDEIKGVLNLLHDQYRKLDMNIILHRNKLSTLLKSYSLSTEPKEKELFASAYKGAVAGAQRNKDIILFPYNYNLSNLSKESGKQCVKLLTTFTLIHEIRHVYQSIHKKKKYDKFNGNYIDAGEEGYHAQWIERDANKFAQRVMNNNMESINDILGVTFDWDCRYGSFKVDF